MAFIGIWPRTSASHTCSHTHRHVDTHDLLACLFYRILFSRVWTKLVQKDLTSYNNSENLSVLFTCTKHNWKSPFYKVVRTAESSTVTVQRCHEEQTQTHMAIMLREHVNILPYKPISGFQKHIRTYSPNFNYILKNKNGKFSETIW